LRERRKMTGAESDTPGLARPELVRVLESAARLQEVVPDAVLVGGSAAAPWASHRTSFDHDHVLQDLSDRFDAVLEAIEATDGWVTNRVTSEVRDLVASSGLSKQDFAERIGTSRSRLSTYLSGRVALSNLDGADAAGSALCLRDDHPCCSISPPRRCLQRRGFESCRARQPARSEH
jgi:hypothetical protein